MKGLTGFSVFVISAIIAGCGYAMISTAEADWQLAVGAILTVTGIVGVLVSL